MDLEKYIEENYINFDSDTIMNWYLVAHKERFLAMEPDPFTIYFILDTQEIYIGKIRMACGK